MTAFHKIWQVVSIVSVAAWIIYILFTPPRYSQSHQTVYDTVTYYDTLRCVVSVPKDSVIIRMEKYVDSVQYIDTVTKTIVSYIPIYQYHYQDTNYNLYVSGYNVTLDSLFIYPPTNIVKPTTAQPLPRWGVSIQSGVTLIAGRPQIYLGVGVSYNLFYLNFGKKKPISTPRSIL